MKYNKRRVDLICNELRNLSSKTAAMKAGGISADTFYKWYNEIPEFKKEVDAAIYETKDKINSTAIKSIVKAMNEDYKAATWWLERTMPDEFGRREKVDTTMTIDAIKIKYIIPENDKDSELLLPLNNDVIKLEIPDEKINEDDGI